MHRHRHLIIPITLISSSSSDSKTHVLLLNNNHGICFVNKMFQSKTNKKKTLDNARETEKGDVSDAKRKIIKP